MKDLTLPSEDPDWAALYVALSSRYLGYYANVSDSSNLRRFAVSGKGWGPDWNAGLIQMGVNEARGSLQHVPHLYEALLALADPLAG
jgi:hypothetical protein